MIEGSIRPESPADHAPIREINLAAFDGPGEAGLVDALRRQARPFVSLVFERGGKIVGHIALSPVTIEDEPGGANARASRVFPAAFMGLAPMAVRPGSQREGIGTRLVEAGLDACRSLGTELVVVLGHPEFYPRFGFRPASRLGLRSLYEVPDEAFMAIELSVGRVDRRFRPDASLPRGRRVVRYHAAFDAL